MNLSIGAALATVLLGLSFFAGMRFESASAMRHEAQALRTQADQMRAEIVSRDQEIKHREQVNAESERGYLATIHEQNIALDSVRADLRNVRLRSGACPRVPATPAASQAPGIATPESRSGLPDDLAEMAGDRFARCDAIVAQLNALIDWNKRNSP